MAEVCYTMSTDDGYVLRCTRDANGLCVVGCKKVKIEAIHPQIAIELKRLRNAIAKYDA